MKVLVLGLGNDILLDDGIGIKIAQEIRKRLNNNEQVHARVDVKESSLAGFALLDEISGYDRLLLVDSIKPVSPTPGRLRKIDCRDIACYVPTSHLASFHGIDFASVMELGRRMGYKIPEIDIYAVEIEDNSTFSEELTPKVKESIPVVVDKILADINSLHCNTEISNIKN